MPDLLPSRLAHVGDGTVRRLLPHARRRRIGAWCFVDHFGPSTGSGPGVGPHPHIGLQTVTWLLDGTLHHGDSIGSDQTIAPGALNLMTAGRGITHWELSRGSSRMHGVQLWIALPPGRRDGPPAFEHHPRLPTVDVDGWVATVLVGTLAGVTSPATVHTPLVGAQLYGVGAAWVPLDPTFEHGVLALDEGLEVDGVPVPVGTLAVLPDGAERVALRRDQAGRALLLGGAPFGEPLVMWWNFVAPDHAAVAAAHADWAAASPRFGDPSTFPGERLDAPRLPAMRLVPR